MSREALRLALAERGYRAELKQLDVEDNHSLRIFPGLTLSLSHTPAAGAAIIADKVTYRSVGVDIESPSRKVKDSIIQRISHPDDGSFLPIELWCLKEACFKALMNSGEFPRPIEFSSIQVRAGAWAHSPSGLCGKLEVRLAEGLVLAEAYLEN